MVQLGKPFTNPKGSPTRQPLPSDALKDRLLALFGDRLASLCLYGEPGPQDEPSQVLVILDALRHDDLERAAEVGAWWERHADALPIFLSREEWAHSADVFALEYADIRDSHRLLHGENLFADLRVDERAMRLVCELEVYRKLVFLRQRLMPYRTRPDMLETFMRQGTPEIAPLFRGVLRLAHPAASSPPLQPHAVFDGMAATVQGFQPGPFQRALAPSKGKNPDALAWYEAYLAQLGLVNRYLNGVHFE